MDVSVIIINYNTEKLVLDCLDSIYAKTYGIDFEIIVVDNDSSKEPLMLKEDKRIKYIRSEINLGFGNANNLGAKYARGVYLFCLNPDTLLVNNAIKILYNFISTRNDVGACGPNLYKDDLTPNISFSVLPTGIYQEFIDSRSITKKHNMTFNNTDECMDVNFSSGAALMIRRSLFDEIGGFGKDFFMYYEDNDICRKIKGGGYRIVNIPQSRVIHLDGKSFTFKKERELLSLKGRRIYYENNYGIVYYYFSSVCYILNNCINLLYFLIIQKNDTAKLLWFRMKNVFVAK